MGKSFITLNLVGFEELLDKINKAQGDIKPAVNKCMEKSAEIQHEELKAQMQKAKVADELIKDMPKPSVEWDGNYCSARVGYKDEGAYNPKDLTNYYKAIFINYGTPKIRKPRQFIKKAKSRAKKKIKLAQEETLKSILENLEK